MEKNELELLSMELDNLDLQFASLESLRNDIAVRGTISQSCVIEAQGIVGSLESARYPVHAYSRQLTASNFTAGLEAFDFKLAGLVVAAITAIIALIGKLLGSSTKATSSVVTRAADVQKSIAIKEVEEDAISAIIDLDNKLKEQWVEAKHASIYKSYVDSFGVPSRQTAGYNRKNAELTLVTEPSLALLFAVANGAPDVGLQIKGYKRASFTQLLHVTHSSNRYLNAVAAAAEAANTGIRKALGSSYGVTDDEDQRVMFDSLSDAYVAVNVTAVAVFELAQSIAELDSFSTPNWNANGRKRMHELCNAYETVMTVDYDTPLPDPDTVNKGNAFVRKARHLFEEFASDFAAFLPDGGARPFLDWYKKVDYHNYSSTLAEYQKKVNNALSAGGVTPVDGYEDIVGMTDQMLEDTEKRLVAIHTEIDLLTHHQVGRSLGNKMDKTNLKSPVGDIVRAIQNQANEAIFMSKTISNLAANIYRREKAAIDIAVNGINFFQSLHKNLDGFCNVVIKNNKDERDEVIRKAMEYVDNIDKNFR